VRLGFRAWLVGTTWSTFFDSVTFFALGWAAASFGADAAGLVLTLGSIPLCLFVLVGGAVADRFGVRRTMIACDAAMALVMTLFVVHAATGVTVTGLCLLSVASGTAAALRRPAEGVFPRLFAADDELARVMATVSAAQQAARLGGPPLGGLLLAMGGLVLTAGLDAVSFVLVLAVLWAVRPPRESAAPGDGAEPMVQAVRAALRAARRVPGVVPMLLGVSALAASALPAVMLCIPLAGRSHDWSAGETGLVAGSWIAGSLVVTGLVSWRGPLGARARVVGPLVGVGGVAALAAATSASRGMLGGCVLGAGTAIWTTTALPVFVRLTPPDMLARFQSLLHLAQTAAVMVALPVLGLVADSWGLTAAWVVVGVVLVGTAAPRLAVVADDRTLTSVGGT